VNQHVPALQVQALIQLQTVVSLIMAIGIALYLAANFLRAVREIIEKV